MKTALVTGGSRGIGLAVVRDLARTHHVIVHGRDEEALRAITADLPSATAWAADLSGPAVTVPPRPNGLPMATTQSPIRAFWPARRT